MQALVSLKGEWLSETKQLFHEKKHNIDNWNEATLATLVVQYLVKSYFPVYLT